MDVSTWLRDLGLEDYAQAFQAHHINAEVLPRLTADDLTAIGVTSVGHRRRLLDAIAALDQARAPAARELTAVATRPLEAERRQLTVMFCDLVGSTELATRLDPEDLGGVMRAYHRCTAAVVERFDGHVAKYLGDGVIAYFGWPRAHEDDAERAVHAGLALVEVVARLETDAGVRLQARIGIATGQVVVGDLVGAGASRDEAAVGEVPNLAARLQGLAEPGAVVVSQTTRRLVGGLFELDDLGPQRLKGFAQPLLAWRVAGEGRLEGRFEARQSAGLTPLVGREAEIALLLRHWDQARDGEGQVVLLSGEPGIGKSRVVRELRARLEGEPYVSLQYQCSPHHTTSPLHPVIEQMERAAGFARDDLPQARLDKLEAVLARGTDQLDQAVPLIAALLGVPTHKRYPPLDLMPQRQKQRTLEMLVDQLEGLSTDQPALVVYEDVHWADPTTLELLDLVIERIRSAPVLCVLTFRPEFNPPWPPKPHVSALALTRLGPDDGAAIVNRVVGGKALPAEVSAQIVAKTDGVPLFVEELTKAVLESGLLTNAGDHYELAGPLPPLAIPATLHDSLMARLDRVASVKEIAQLGAVIGREFSYSLLAAVAERPADQLRSALDQLVASELVLRHGTTPSATYSFKHALVQDAAYSTLLKARRQQLHARILKVLDEQFPETAETQPELLAHHITEAGSPEKAVDVLYNAGRQAIARSATVKAVAQLDTALKLLVRLPDGPERRRRELDLQLALGPALIAAKGFAAPETERAYARACELCRELGDIPNLLRALYGQSVVHWQRAEMAAAKKVAGQLLRLAEEQVDGVAEVVGHRIFGAYQLALGELSDGRDILERGLNLYNERELTLDDPERRLKSRFVYAVDSRVVCLHWLSHTLLLLGYPDKARKQSQEALDWAEELDHPNSKAPALLCHCTLHQLLQDDQAARDPAEELIALTEEQSLPLWLAQGKVIRGWALAVDRCAGDVIQAINGGLADYRATGAELFSPYFLALLADAHGRAGQAGTGLNLLADALRQLQHTDYVGGAVEALDGQGAIHAKGDAEEREPTGVRWIEAELHRLRGDLLAHSVPPGHAAAEACYRKAIKVATGQSAKWWELRAAVSLARLLCDQGKRAEAHDLLAPIYGWFTEGFDTADLKDAKALLEELA